VEKENPAPLVDSGNRADINVAQHSVDSPPSPAAQDWRGRLAERGITVHPADQKDALRVLEDATRFLSQRRSEVLAVPRPVRLMQAMAIIDALGLGIDDLVVGWPR
jgi:hypothetical protein